MKEKWLSDLIAQNLTIEMLASQVLPKNASSKEPVTGLLIKHAEQAFKTNK